MAVNTRDDKIRKTIEFRKENYDWLEQNFRGSTWWIINELLAAFKQVTAENLPVHYARIGAKELAEKLDISPDITDD